MPSTATPASNILTVRGLSRRFGGLQAVDALDLDLPRGRLLALIGPNGAGKSTTVNLLAGVTAPSAGRIVLGTQDLTGRPAHAVARAGLARTFQNGRLFPRLSVLENVLVGADARYRSGFWASVLRSPGFRAEQREQRERALQLLDELGLAGDAQREVRALPYGRQRQIEIARALILEPKVLVLDEPAAGLNSGEVAALIEHVSALRAGGLSILLIEHNMGLVMRLADRIAVLNFGQLIADGAPDEVRANEAVIEAYLGRRKAASARQPAPVAIAPDRRGAPVPPVPTPPFAVRAPMLRCDGLSVAYGSVQALDGVSLHVARGECVALLGANGAGKTTLLRAISGLVKPHAGSVTLAGADLARTAPEQRVRIGLAHAPERRRIFPGLSVLENLQVATSGWRGFRESIAGDLERVFTLFPRLKERRAQLGWSLSGGEQQMLAIGRALMSRPQVLLLDEPSLGLAPLLSEEVYAQLAILNGMDLTMLIVEQNTAMALSVASRAYVLEHGRVVLEGAAAELLDHPRVREAYLGA